jgi:hypothetical protein
LKNIEVNLVPIQMNLRNTNSNSHPLASFEKILILVQIVPVSRRGKKTDSPFNTIWYEGMMNLKGISH